jgi:hypothetical protein
MYEAARADTLMARPGERFSYSDAGYFLLGMIIEKASGMPWRNFVRQRILEPLSMNDSYLQDLDRIHRNEARGYTITNGELVNIRRVRQVETPSAAGIFSNVTDLVKWDAALYGNTLLTEASRTAMWTPLRLNDGSASNYGFGWNLWCQRGRPVHEHTGLTGTQMFRLPADTLTIIVLTNLGGPSEEVNSWGLAPRIAEMIIPALASKQTERILSKEAREQFVGSYRFVSGSPRADPSVRIGVSGERVHMQIGEATLPLIYVGGDMFTIEGDPAVVYVHRARSGRVESWEVREAEPVPSSSAVRTRADCAGPLARGTLKARALRAEP